MTANEEALTRPEATARGLSRVVRSVIYVLVAAVLAGAAVYRWQQARGRSPDSSITARVVRPEMRDVDATVVATGTIRIRSGAEVRVGTQISGIVTKLNVTVGSHIERGEAIAEIDSRGLDARLIQARSQIAVDEAAVKKVEHELERNAKLLEAGLIPRQQEEDAAMDVHSAEARLAKSKSDLTVVESDLPYLTIRAPISGTVSAVSTQQGETVAASFNAPTFVTIIEDKALELIAMVDETDIGNVRRANPVVFTTETFPSEEFRGVVERVAPKATIISGVVNYETAIAIRTGLAILKPDMTANVTISTAHRRVLMVPTEAVHQAGEAPFVYVDRNGVREKRVIVVGQRSGTWNEVRSGLRADERLVVGDAGVFKESRP